MARKGWRAAHEESRGLRRILVYIALVSRLSPDFSLPLAATTRKEDQIDSILVDPPKVRGSD
jgi:hypothetical protein